MKAVKKEEKFLNPAWFRETAKLAMKRGTSLVFAKDGTVYGFLPKSSGSVTVFYKPDAEWVDAVLALYPKGAVFPNNDAFGGPATAKLLRPYASIGLPEGEGKCGKAWIDPITSALHVKGIGATIHSANFAECDIAMSPPPSDIPNIEFPPSLTKDMCKFLSECTGRDENRPFLKRIYGFFVNETHYLGTTNGKVAVVQECDKLPSAFSCDPTLTPLGDILGFAYRSSPADNADIRHYRMNDGTVLSEKLVVQKKPEFEAIFGSANAAEKTVLLSSLMLRTLVDSIGTLGLGVADVHGGILRFSAGKTEMISGNECVAEFEIAADIDADTVLHVAFSVLSKLAKLGGDFLVCDGGSPYYCAAGTAQMLAMPVRIG